MTHLLLGAGPGAGAGGGGGPTDPNFSSVKLLMGFEGTNGSTGAPGMNDESSAAHGTASIAGGAVISTAQKQFGGSSVSLTSSGQVAFANSADWQLGSGAFTIEGWVNPTSGGTGTMIALWGSGNQLSWLLFVAVGGDNKLHWDTSTTGSNVLADIVGSTSLSTGTWYAWAIDFDGSKYRLYLNGVMDGSFSTPRTLFNSTATLSMGASFGGGNNLTGYLDEIRLTKGVARYASDSGYTVATSAFPRS